jgi:hypothetical protein
MKIVNAPRGKSGRSLLALVLGGAALLASANSARAVQTTLDTLLSGGTLTLGDKSYSGFTFSSNGDAPVTASQVNVNLTSDDLNRYNLRFSFGQDALASTAGQSTDVVIGYRVDVLGSQRINGVGLAFDSTVGAGQSPGLAAATVQEIVRTVDGSDLSPGAPDTDTAVMDVFNDGTGGLPDESSTTLAVNPTSSLLFQKDILVSSRPAGGRVVINTVDNFVNQVPEPTSAALLAFAGAALLARRRRA